MKSLLILLLSTLPLFSFAQDNVNDKEQLAHAVEYFNNEKFHEAGLIFRQLNKKYELNTRFKAYLGICEHHDWNFSAATEIFDSIYKDLSVYAPLEQNVYYNTAADSHFNLGNYKEATHYYQMSLSVCSEIEKAELQYKLGICYLQLEDKTNARLCLSNADQLFQKNPTEKDRNRIKQIKRMLVGLASD